MKPALAFNSLVKQIHVLLKKNGFKKQGNSFYKQQDRNWGLISFQKSVKTTALELFFTVNLGVCSHAIRAVFHPDMAKNKPIFTDCHWQKRLGHFITNEDIWWTINENTDSTNVMHLTQEIENLLIQYALPAIENLISDEQLENFWYSKLPNKLGCGSKLELAVLLKKSGKMDKFNLILKQLEEEIEGKSTEPFFKADITKLLNSN